MSAVVILIIMAIFGIVIMFAAGILIGLMIANGRSSQAGKDKSPLTGPANMVEIARIWQDKKSGQPYPEVNGKMIRFPADLSAGQRERLAGVFSVLLGWISPPRPEAPVAGAPAGAPGVPVAAAAAAPPKEEAALYTPASVNATPPSLNPIDVVSRAIQSEVRVPPASDRSIVMQIDDILQEKIAGSELANKGIRLVELPSKDLVVMVGMTQYEGIEAVPDAEIKGLIRESVAEWEKKSAEG